jgi:hypothetical protein
MMVLKGSKPGKEPGFPAGAMSARYLEVGRSLKEDRGRQEHSGFPVTVAMALRV